MMEGYKNLYSITIMHDVKLYAKVYILNKNNFEIYTMIDLF